MIDRKWAGGRLCVVIASHMEGVTHAIYGQMDRFIFGVVINRDGGIRI